MSRILCLALLCGLVSMLSAACGTTDVDFQNMTYAAFGDSITFGGDFHNNYAQMETPYPKAVAETLGLAAHDNYGIGGAVLTENTLGLVNMTAVIESVTAPYDIISVMGGVNDFNAGLPLGTEDDIENNTIYGSLDRIARHLTTHYPDAFLFFMTPYPEYYGGLSVFTKNSAGYYLSDVAIAVKTVAKRYDIAVLDLYTSGKFETVMYDNDCDGLHPNQDFILAQTAPQIAAFIKRHIQT